MGTRLATRSTARVCMLSVCLYVIQQNTQRFTKGRRAISLSSSPRPLDALMPFTGNAVGLLFVCWRQRSVFPFPTPCCLLEFTFSDAREF